MAEAFVEQFLALPGFAKYENMTVHKCFNNADLLCEMWQVDPSPSKVNTKLVCQPKGHKEKAKIKQKDYKQIFDRKTCKTKNGENLSTMQSVDFTKHLNKDVANITMKHEKDVKVLKADVNDLKHMESPPPKKNCPCFSLK